tara:strand:- start:340 stop:600 length:261 start_codon:yes stop_codon:yes gene_type:complete
MRGKGVVHFAYACDQLTHCATDGMGTLCTRLLNLDQFKYTLSRDILCQIAQVERRQNTVHVSLAMTTVKKKVAECQYRCNHWLFPP